MWHGLIQTQTNTWILMRSRSRTLRIHLEARGQWQLGRLAEPEMTVQEQLRAVLEEVEATQGTDAPKPLRAGVKRIVCQVMTEGDWEALTGRS
jgi:hypothetical protein